MWHFACSRAHATPCCVKEVNKCDFLLPIQIVAWWFKGFKVSPGMVPIWQDNRPMQHLDRKNPPCAGSGPSWSLSLAVTRISATPISKFKTSILVQLRYQRLQYRIHLRYRSFKLRLGYGISWNFRVDRDSDIRRSSHFSLSTRKITDFRVDIEVQYISSRVLFKFANTVPLAMAYPLEP